MLGAIQATKCLFDFAELENAMQVQLQVFEPHNMAVWTADIAANEGLQSQNQGRWIWTPLTCLVDTKNVAYTEEIRPWILTGLE